MNQITDDIVTDKWGIHRHLPLLFCFRWYGSVRGPVLATAARDVEGVLRIRPRVSDPLPPIPFNAHEVLDAYMKRRT